MKLSFKRIYLSSVIMVLSIYATSVFISPSLAFGGAAGSQGPDGPDNQPGGLNDPNKGSSNGSATGKKAPKKNPQNPNAGPGLYTGPGPGGMWGVWDIKPNGVWEWVGQAKHSPGKKSSDRKSTAKNQNCGRC